MYIGECIVKRKNIWKLLKVTKKRNRAMISKIDRYIGNDSQTNR